MRPLLNTLFVTTADAHVGKDGECLAVRVGNETRARIPVHGLEGVVCFGRVSVSPFAMAHCAEHGVALTHLTEHGRFLARVQGAARGNVLLRRTQYRWADDGARSAAMARFMLKAKLHNARLVLRRGARETKETVAAEALSLAADHQARALGDLERTTDLDVLRGIEGDAGRGYWQAFRHLVTVDEPAFRPTERSRRPPRDPMNALLSFLYTLLMHDVRSALEGVGLDPYVGFLHRDRPGRAGLALDLMEEFRPLLADRLALTLVNRRQVQASGFEVQETGGVIMDDTTRKEVLVAWQRRKQEMVTHPFLNETLPFGLVSHVQALLMARHLRGDLDGYPAFLGQ